MRNRTEKQVILGQMSLELLLNEMVDAHVRYLNGVSDIYKTYDKEAKLAHTQSFAYKDEKQFILNTMAPKKQAAKEGIARLQRLHNEEMQLVAEEMKTRYYEAITKKPSAEFMSALSVYKDFGINGTPLQYEALLAANKGNLLGLMAIKNVMQQNNSAYTVEFIPAENFEKDLETLMKIAYNSYGRVVLPNFEENESSKAIFENEPDGECPFENAEKYLDITEMRNRSARVADPTEMTLKEMTEKNACRNISDIRERWKQLSDGSERYIESPSIKAHIVKAVTPLKEDVKQLTPDEVIA